MAGAGIMSVSKIPQVGPAFGPSSGGDKISNDLTPLNST